MTRLEIILSIKAKKSLETKVKNQEFKKLKQIYVKNP